jgi:hypothetical protein
MSGRPSAEVRQAFQMVQAGKQAQEAAQAVGIALSTLLRYPPYRALKQLPARVPKGQQQRIVHEGEVWRVLSTGIERDGKIFVHLASVSRMQKNGIHAVQINDWVPVGKIKVKGKQP